MFDKTRIIAAAKSITGFREDNNAIYDALYNKATANGTNTFVFNNGLSTITWTGKNFEDEGFAIGDSITISGTTSNNGTKTITAIAAGVITTSGLTNETATSGTIQALSDLQKSASGIFVNDLSGVTFEIIDANLSPDTDAKTYLQNVYESQLLSLVNQFVNRAKQFYNSKELMARQTIVSGVASMRDVLTQNQRFVGYWIRPNQSNYLKTEIVQLGFQSSDTQATPLKVYLYETSQLEPIATFDFIIDKKFSLVWRDVQEFILNYQSETGGTGQSYLLGYYEKDIENPQAYQLQNQAVFMNFACGCPNEPRSIYGKYLDIQPIEIPNQYLNFEAGQYNIPLVDDLLNFVTDHTYGLNAKINVTCDITDVLVQNIGIFANALQHAIACKLLYDAYASNRINSISDSKREQCKMFAINYDGILNGYTTPEGVKINGILSGLNMDFSGMDKYCLPCRTGIQSFNLVR